MSSPERGDSVDGEESAAETGLGNPALQILDEEVAGAATGGAAVGGPTGQGRAVVCRVRREQAGNVCDKRLPLLQTLLISRPGCWRRSGGFRSGCCRSQPSGLWQEGLHLWGALGMEEGQRLGVKMTLGTQCGLPSFWLRKLHQTSIRPNQTLKERKANKLTPFPPTRPMLLIQEAGRAGLAPGHFMLQVVSLGAIANINQ